MRFPSVLLAALLLSGCTVTHYQPPREGEPFAYLKVRNTSGQFANFWPTVDAERCTGLLVEDSLFRLAPTLTAEIKVKAGEDFSLLATQDAAIGMTQTHCSAPATFRPDYGRTYVADFYGDTRSCRLTIRREVSSAATLQTVSEPSFRSRRWVEPIIEESHCE